MTNETAISADKSALVIGCGLGDDAEALQAFGYRVTAFDISPTAIAWCRERFPNSQVNYQVADLFQLPQNWESSFDLVYECRNIQALPIDARDEKGNSWRSRAISTLVSLVKNGGKLLLISRIRPDDTFAEGPPWGLSPQELAEFSQPGWETVSDRSFSDDRDIAHTSRLFAKK